MPWLKATSATTPPTTSSLSDPGRALALVDGGRAVLYGYGRENSATLVADPHIDLLAEAPDWLPLDDLERRAAADDLGFVLWHDGGGAAWTRVGYPGGVEDGMQEMVDWALDESATLTQLEDVVWEWGQDERRHGRGA